MNQLSLRVLMYCLVTDMNELASVVSITQNCLCVEVESSYISTDLVVPIVRTMMSEWSGPGLWSMPNQAGKKGSLVQQWKNKLAPTAASAMLTLVVCANFAANRCRVIGSQSLAAWLSWCSDGFVLFGC